MKDIPLNVQEILEDNNYKNWDYIKNYIDQAIAGSESGITEARANQLIKTQVDNLKTQTIATVQDVSSLFSVNTGITVSSESKLTTGKIYWDTEGTRRFEKYGDNILRVNIDGLKYMNLVNNKRSDNTTYGVLIGTLNGYVGNGNMINNGYSELYVRWSGTYGVNAKSYFYLRELKSPSTSQKRSINFDYLCNFRKNG